MGYYYQLKGKIKCNAKLPKDFIEYLQIYCKTEHFERSNTKIKKLYKDWEERCYTGYLGPNGLYFAHDDTKTYEEEKDPTIKMPPNVNEFCPSQWCPYTINSKSEIVPASESKENEHIFWIKFLIDDFLSFPGWKLNGKIEYIGELPFDRGIITVKNSKISVDYRKKVKWGLLCINEKEAKKKGYDIVSGYNYTGLDTYLNAMYPKAKDWKYDSSKHLYVSKKLKKMIYCPGYDCFKVNKNFKKMTNLYNVNFREAEKLGYEFIYLPLYLQITKTLITFLFKDTKNKNVHFSGTCSCLSSTYNFSYNDICSLAKQDVEEDIAEYCPELYSITGDYVSFVDYYVCGGHIPSCIKLN